MVRKKKRIQALKDAFGKLKDDGYNFDLIEGYFKNKSKNKNKSKSGGAEFQALSDKTCADLDFDELFMFVDRTESRVGQQFLYNKLRTIPLSDNGLKLEEKIIASMADQEDLRIRAQLLLGRLKRDDVYYLTSLFQEEYLKPPKWFFVIRLLSFTSLLSIILLFFTPQIVLVLVAVFLVNVVIHYWNKRNLFQYLGSIPQLLRLSHVASQLYKEESFKDLNPDLPKAIKVIDQVKSRMAFFQLEARLQGEMEAVFWALMELFKTVFLLEPLLLFGVLKRLDIKRQEIESVFEFVGQVDAIISICDLRAGLKTYCQPIVKDNDTQFSGTDLYHPLIDNCVTNSIAVKDRSILLTGSNMSGKTSFIRTIGLNLISGLTLNTCFAKDMVLPRMKVHSAIRISDDLLNDKSYYFEEVLTIKAMMDQSQLERPCLFLLDEIFKGTNTIERISAGKAVLSSLAKNQNIVFVSTHDIELTDLLEEEYELYHFSERVEDKNVDFDYKLKKGRLKKRNAIRILEINDYPPEVVQEAMQIAGQFDRKMR